MKIALDPPISHMAAIFAFKCSCCGRIHEGSPSYGFKAPDHYACLSEEQKAKPGSITPARVSLSAWWPHSN